MTRPAYVRQLAAELELLAHGSTTSWNPAGGGGVPSSRMPSGESQPPHMLFLAEWDRRGDACLNKWNDLLKGWKGIGRLRSEGMSDREIVLTDGEGHSAKDVAGRFRVTETLVRKWRVNDGRNADTGKRVQVTGRTQKQIADELGVSQPTVHRMQRKAA